MSKWGTWVNLWISQIHLTRQQKNVGENYDDLASRRLIRTRSTQEFACIFLKRDLNGKWSWSLLEFHRLNSRVEQRTRLVPDGLLAQNIIQWWIFLMTALHWFYFVTIQKSVSEKPLDSLLWPVCVSGVWASNSGYRKRLGFTKQLQAVTFPGISLIPGSVLLQHFSPLWQVKLLFFLFVGEQLLLNFEAVSNRTKGKMCLFMRI